MRLPIVRVYLYDHEYTGEGEGSIDQSVKQKSVSGKAFVEQHRP